MNTVFRRLLTSTAVLVGLAAAPAWAQTAAPAEPVAPVVPIALDGRLLYADKGCVACHGEDAKTPLDVGYPRLAGQNAAYIVNQIKDIQSGARANRLSVDTMKPIVAEIPEAEIQAIADWLSTLPRPTQVPADHPGLALYKTKTCIACHGKDALKPLLKTYPLIAGQEKAYLLGQMQDIKTGVRTNGNAKAMTPVMHLVTDQEMDSIADFLTNVK